MDFGNFNDTNEGSDYLEIFCCYFVEIYKNWDYLTLHKENVLNAK